MLYIFPGYDVTNYFRSEATAKKTVENAASDGLRWNFSRRVDERITKFHKVVGDSRPHKFAGYDIASCFRSAAKCN